MRFDFIKSTLPSRKTLRHARVLARPRTLCALALAGAVAFGTVTTAVPAHAGLTAGATSGDADSQGDGSLHGDESGNDEPSSADRLSPGVSQPSKDQMNRTHDHVMGAGVRENSDPDMKAGAKEGSKPKPKPKHKTPKKKHKSTGPVHGVDVSGWDSITASGWKSMSKKGVGFAYVKATEGTSFTSGSYKKQYRQSARAGLVRGAYHFATPNSSSGAKQAKYFLAHGGTWKADGKTLPPLLDIEYNPYGGTCYGLGNHKMVSWIKDFSATVKKRTGRTPAIYTTADWWKQCTGNSHRFADNALFIARYPKHFSDGAGSMPGGWKHYTFWQYTESGKPVADKDVFRGGRDELRALAKGTGKHK